MSLYEMLTGKVPFDDMNVSWALVSRVRYPAPSAKELAPDVSIPEGVERVLRTFVKRDPARRPASAEAAVEQMIAAAVVGDLR